MHPAQVGSWEAKPCDMAEIRGYGSGGFLSAQRSPGPAPSPGLHTPSSPSDLACADMLASH